jgi:toxin YoeB
VPKYKVETGANFAQEYRYWVKNSQTIATKIDELLRAIQSDPFKGIGKPEPLRWGPFKGCWSRRITKEHRLVYKVHKNIITFLQCRYHY